MLIDYNYLRIEKAKLMQQQMTKRNTKNSSVSAYTYPLATILPLKKFESDKLPMGRGGVVDNRKNYIDISAIEGMVQFSYDFDESNYEDKKIVYCGYFSTHWGHFLMESISRLWYVLENDTSVDKYVFFIDSDSEVLLTENFKEFFKLLGILDEIEFINKPTSYREVVIPERGFLGKDNNCQQFKNMIEHIYHNIQPDNSWKTFDKIFLTRSQFDKALKNEFGMEALDSFFYNNNYKIIYPEKLTLSYMIYLLRNAEVCATMAGTPQHNLLFSYEGQQIIILT